MDGVDEQQVRRQGVGAAVLVAVATVAAWVVVAAGVVLAVVVVRDETAGVPVRLSAAAPAYAEHVVPCVEGWPADGSAACEPAATADQWPGGEPLPVQRTGGMAIGASGAPLLPALASTFPTWGGLLAAGVVVLLLVPVLRGTAAGRLFQPGNARRLALAAGVVLLAWGLATAGPVLAAPTVIDLVEHAPRYTETGPLRTFPMPTGWLEPDLRIGWWPLAPALLLAALAGATRAGTRVAADTEGLV